MTTLTPLAADAARHFEWTRSGPVAKIVAALEAREAGCARFVGGCVRDSLLGEAPKDIDIATTLEPPAVIEALHAAGLSAAPTGLDHGTITGIADHVGVEITTLRADVSTDGRRATVAFTRDWEVDARRRDFTLNAIYLTTDAKLYDPVGGLEDAKARRVQFIGAAEDRIREDYLRILRFFRFSARFAGGFDAVGLAACAALHDGMKQLSAERIGDEFARILALPRAALAIDAMVAADVIGEVWPAAPDREALRSLKERNPDAPAMVALAALWGAEGEGIAARLRLSNADAARRRKAVEAARDISPALNDMARRALLYRLGETAWCDGARVAAARAGGGADWDALIEFPGTWSAPIFPYTGKHVIAAGVPKGPRVAKTLAAVEAKWIAEDFPGAERLAEILKGHVDDA